MDKYVIKEPKTGGEYPPSNFMQFRINQENSTMMNSEQYENHRGFAPEYTMYRHDQSGYMQGMSMTHVNGLNVGPINMIPVQNQSRMSGIDPRYLAAYADNNAPYITGQQQCMPREQIMLNNAAFSSEFQNRNLLGANRNNTKTFMQQGSLISEPLPKARPEYTKTYFNTEKHNFQENHNNYHKAAENKTPEVNPVKAVTPKPSNVVDVPKNTNSGITRMEKLKAIYKNGPRVFSGPVEKVLKWHKVLQDIGILVLYEIVGKCVNIRPGEMGAKSLVVRDENGPAMQVVYYEIDFLFPELKPPCTVRVIGRMTAGTCRLQAFFVRLATGDDVATLPRRAAVAAHHVAKICKEYADITTNV